MSEPRDLELELPGLTDLAPPALSPTVRAAVGDAPAPVRPLWPTWARVGVAAAVGGAVTVVAVLMMGGRWEGGAGSLPGSWWLVSLAAWLGATVVLTWLAVAEAEPRTPVESLPRVLLLLVLAVFFAGMAVYGDVVVDGGLDAMAVGELVRSGIGCLALGSVVETGPVLVVFLLLARGRAFHPVRAGIFGGVAAAGWSVVILELHCPSLAALHVVPFHFGVALVWGLLGAGVGLWLRRRSP